MFYNAEAILRKCTSSITHESTSGFVSRYARGNEFVPLAILGVTTGIVIALCLKPTPMVLDCINVVMSMMWACRYLAMDPPTYFYSEPWIATCRIVQGFVLGKSSFTWLLHMGVTIIDVVSYRRVKSFID